MLRNYSVRQACSSSRRLSWWAGSIAWVCVLMAIPSAGLAHFAWVLLPETDSRQFAVVFSEGLRPDNPEYLAKMANAPVTIHGADGRKTTVALELTEDRLIGWIPDDFDAIAIEVPVTWGVITRGGESFLLKYRALGIVDLSRAEQVKFELTEAAGPLLRLQRHGRSVRLRGSVGQNPLAATPIKIVGVDETQSVETSPQGWVAWTPASRGDYGLYAKASQAESGQLAGQNYQEIRTYVTVSVRVGVELVTATTDDAENSAVASVSAKDLGGTLPALPFGITSFGAARIKDSLYVYGGHTGTAHSYWNTSQSNQLLRWDRSRADGTWHVVAEGAHRLQGLAMVAHDDRLILVGGFFAQNEEGEPHQLFSQDQVMAFDTVSGQWSSLPRLPQGRSSHDAIVWDDHLYVVGGWLLNGSSETQWHETALVMDLRDPEAGWSELPAPGFQRRALAVAAFDNKIFVVGGMDRSGGPTLATSVYDPHAQRWSSGPPLVGAQGMVGFGAAAWPLDGRLIVTAYDGSVQALSADQHAWISLGQTQDARFFHRLLPYAPGHLILVGGANMDSGKFVDLEVIRVEPLEKLIAK